MRGSSGWRVLWIVIAVIVALAVAGALGMLVMHRHMMGGLECC